MTILCITGAPAPALQHVAQALQQAGMAQPRSLDRQPPITLQDWHGRVLARASADEAHEPGRMWEQLATDLFLANIDVPLSAT